MTIKKTKILYLITQSELGGAQKHVLDLADSLKENYDILVAAGNDGGGALLSQLSERKIKNLNLRWLRRAINPFFDLLSFWEIRRLLKTEKPDILHLHSSKAGLLGSLASISLRQKIKVIYTSHGAAFSASFSKKARKFFLLLEWLSGFFKDKIICVSQNEKKIWLKENIVPKEKLITVANGLDLKILSEILPKNQARDFLAGASPAFFTAMANQPANLKIIGAIANFYPDKGLPYLVETADLIIKQKKLSDIIFAIIGDGPERKLLEEIINARGLKNRFILTGAIVNPIKYLKAFDIYVQPSIKEGFGYTVLEAMAAGAPIAASAIGGIPEMITDGFNGFLVPPADPQALADKIIELLANPELAQKFSQNSLVKIREFSLEKMATETEKIYQAA